ncbi:MULTISPECIES: response regulator transcription factor [Malaciobacter]|jgi:DNA-binding response OmpR family regulator|uniref:DNA-binding response OmpR family regulator n=2 Tax=Malaciobacter TaxID=2321114 RepID=A0AB36ZW20_9BACT|nr:MULTISPECIES: response regulator transcription factor [Malaciobacter]PHO10909.1 DNA-binding response regulator [Malaciobacter canalis]PPK60806.1 DNA-binding response OmpR family regulator [Malaciobacter marinus]QEE32982.1 signal transduction response regulator, OmpR family [Malaciobacter canalis]SKB41095.1 DNA-binding response regulator, OmpR family, contains REC and winged-helix (wHTH) domain [Malaciobacter marinus]
MNKYKQLQKESSALNILFIEDDEDLRHQSEKIFKTLFNQVDLANDGKEGLEKYLKFYEEKNYYYDIVITDIKMPKKNGIELTKDILKINKDQDVIVISAYEDSKYLIELINLGVNNFVQKPLIIDQLIDPLLNICKRINNSKEASEKVFFIENFVWDKENKTLLKKGQEVKLSSSETVLLNLLINNPYITFSNEDIYNTLFSDKYDKELSIDSIKSLIKRIRKKIPTDMIKNIYGEGYRVNKDIFVEP